HLSPTPARPHHLLRLDHAVRAPHRLASLQAPEVRAGADPEALRELGVEPARPLVLDQGVPVCAHAVLDGERAHLVAVVANRLARLELHQLDPIADSTEDSAKGLEQLAHARRTPDPKQALRALPVAALPEA